MDIGIHRWDHPPSLEGWCVFLGWKWRIKIVFFDVNYGNTMVGYFDMVKYGTTNGYNCYGNLASTMVGYKYKYIYKNTGWGPQDCVQVPYFSG
jgi:hypothetical protein